MAKSLVVVESPAKAKTINKYLGRDFKVVASMGHIRDLPKSKLGVDVEEGFEPQYEVIPGRRKVIRDLKAAAKSVETIYVATDPDREGEAIGWHVAEELGGPKKHVRRLMFNEITRKAVLAALQHPGDIDKRMVHAQQARRVLDRLVGYKISPLLWDKIRRGLSAGRVQSVALKLVCDREREIDRFVPEEFWNLLVRLVGLVPPEFEAKLVKRAGEAIRIGTAEEAQRIVEELERLPFIVSSVATKERRRNAPPPFITSKLQQLARFPVKKTMLLAQQLYEGIELGAEGSVGLITYMRTDSTRVADEAIDEVRGHIGETYGAAFVPEQPNYFRPKSDTQDAHEAIRPTSMECDPERVKPHLTRDQYALYRLIWNRFVASQMAPAVFDETVVDIGAGEYLFRVKGSVPRFSGWLAVYGQPGDQLEAEAQPGAGTGAAEGEEEVVAGTLPPLAEGDRLERQALRTEQKFTQPPPRYSEATLVKALEENGIGRPSTYAQIISVIQVREYVEKLEGRFRPTKLGMLVSDLLTKSFDDILDVEYTREMEEVLDRIEEGKADYRGTVDTFYQKFSRDLTRAARVMPNVKADGIPSQEVCDKCGSPMVIKAGRFGLFLACSAYPDCQNTRELETVDSTSQDGEELCENCGRPMVVKRGRFGQFLACTGYPECRTTRKLLSTKDGLTAAKPDQILEETCPRCGAKLVVKHGRFGEFTACSNYPSCRYIKLKSTGVACPKCGGDIVERKSRRGRVFYGCSAYPKCDFTAWNRPLPEKCPECGSPYLLEKITKRTGRQVVCPNDQCKYVRREELATA